MNYCIKQQKSNQRVPILFIEDVISNAARLKPYPASKLIKFFNLILRNNWNPFWYYVYQSNHGNFACVSKYISPKPRLTWKFPCCSILPSETTVDVAWNWIWKNNLRDSTRFLKVMTLNLLLLLECFSFNCIRVVSVIDTSYATIYYKLTQIDCHALSQ